MSIVKKSLYLFMFIMLFWINLSYAEKINSKITKKISSPFVIEGQAETPLLDDFPVPTLNLLDESFANTQTTAKIELLKMLYENNSLLTLPPRGLQLPVNSKLPQPNN